jgi:hypothetical protein
MQQFFVARNVFTEPFSSSIRGVAYADTKRKYTNIRESFGGCA